MSDWYVQVGPDRTHRIPDGLDETIDLGWATIAWRSTSKWIHVAADDERWVLVDGSIHRTGAASDDATWVSSVCGRRAWLESIKGDFVLIVADRRAETITIARDPIGARPCFFAAGSGRMVASPLQRDILANSWVDRRPDHHTIAEMLAGPLGHEDRTVHLGVTRLLPGTALTVPSSAIPSVRATRRPRIQRRSISWEKAIEEVRSLLDDAVRMRLAIGETTAFEVSGGLDSSSVAATASSMTDAMILGRIVFDDERADERKYSDAVARHLGLPLLDAPPFLAGPAWLDVFVAEWRVPPPPPNGLMARSLHSGFREQGATTVVTGLGGDDAFGAQLVGPRVLSALRTGDRAELARLGRWITAHPRATWPLLVRPVVAELAWRRRSASFGLSLLEPAYRRDLGIERRVIGPAVRDTSDPAIDRRSEMLRDGWITRLLEDLAVVTDPLDIRLTHPFFDIDLIEATYGLPPGWPRRCGADRSLQRVAFGPRLPENVRNRTTKAEFSATAWASLPGGTLELARHGPVRELAEVDGEAVDRLVDAAKAKMPGSVIPASSLVSIDRWLRAT